MNTLELCLYLTLKCPAIPFECLPVLRIPLQAGCLTIHTPCWPWHRRTTFTSTLRVIYFPSNYIYLWKLQQEPSARIQTRCLQCPTLLDIEFKFLTTEVLCNLGLLSPGSLSCFPFPFLCKCYIHSRLKFLKQAKSRFFPLSRQGGSFSCDLFTA